MISMKKAEIQEEKEGEKEGDGRKSALRLAQALVITYPHLLELLGGHALRTGLEASTSCLPELITLSYRPVWTLEQQSLQSLQVHFLFP